MQLLMRQHDYLEAKTTKFKILLLGKYNQEEDIPLLQELDNHQPNADTLRARKK